MVSTRAITVGSRYQVNESIRHGTMARLWDKITRKDRQQIALHLPAGGTQPGRHVATGVPKADFSRLMKVTSPTTSGPQAGSAQKQEVFTAHNVLAAAGVPSWALEDHEAVDLAQQIGRGTFGFGFSAAPESLRGPLAALEARDPKLAELVLDRLHGPGGEEAAAKHLTALLKAVRSDPAGAEVAVAREAILKDLGASFEKKLTDTAASFADRMGKAAKNPGAESHAAGQRALTSTLSQLLIDEQGRLLSGEGLDQLIEAFKQHPSTDVQSPATASQLRSLESLRTDAATRSLVNSIGDSGTQAVRLAPAAERLVRAGVNRPADQALTHADLRRSALSALLMPLRQGNVGSCFATSVGLLLKETHPKSFLADLKRLMEDGVMVRQGAGSPPVIRTVPLSQQTDTSRLATPAGSGRSTEEVVRLRVMQAQQAIQPEVEPTRLAVADFANHVRKPALASMRAEAQARNPASPDRFTYDDLLRKLVAQRHGAQSLPGDIAAVRERMRSLITERSDLRERVVPESTRLKDTPQAARDELQKKVSDAAAAVARQKALNKNFTFNAFVDVDIESNQETLKDLEATHADLVRQVKDIDGAAVRLDRAQERLAQIDDLIRQAESDLARFADVQMELDDVEAYEADLSLARSRFLARIDDPLLRAWEYTLASGSERMEAGHFSKKLLDSQSDAMRAAIKQQLAQPNAPGVSRRVPDGFSDSLLAEFQRLFKERVSYRYDAATPTTLASDGHSSAGAWQLYSSAGPGQQGSERPIIGKQAYKELAADLLREAADSIAKQYRGKVDARAFAAGLAQEIYTSDRFVDRTREDLQERLGKDQPANPWLLPEGGVMFDSLAWAWGLDGRPSAPDTFKPFKAAESNTAEQLFEATLDNAIAAKALFKEEDLKDLHRLALPATHAGHGFRFLPGHPDLRAILDGSSDAAALKADLKTRSEAALAVDVPSTTLDAIFQSIEERRGGSQGPAQKALASVRQHLTDQAAAGQPVRPADIAELFRNSIDREARSAHAAVIEAQVRLEIEAGPELEAKKLEASIPPAEVAAWKDIEIKTRTEEALQVQLSLYRQTWVEPLEDRLFQELVAPKARTVVADLNWGSGTDPQLMAFSYDPFKKEFASGIYRAGASGWTSDPSFAQKGFEISAGPELVRTPPKMPA